MKCPFATESDIQKLMDIKDEQIRDWSEKARRFAELYADGVNKNIELERKLEKNTVTDTLLKRIKSLEDADQRNHRANQGESN